MSNIPTLEEALSRASDHWLDTALDRCMTKDHPLWVTIDLLATGDMSFGDFTHKHARAWIKDLYKEKLRRLKPALPPKPYVMQSQSSEALYEAKQAKVEPKKLEFRNVKDELVLTLAPQYDWLRLPLINCLIEADLMWRVNSCTPMDTPHP